MFELRPASPGDAEAIWSFDPDVCPDDLAVEEGLDVVATPSGARHAVGWGSAFPDNPNESGSYRLHLTVHPDWRCQGAGTLLLDHLLAVLRSWGASVVNVRILEIEGAVLQFFHRRGFMENRRMLRLLLALQNADLMTLTSHVDRMRRCGIEIVSMADEEREAVDCLGLWYEFVSAEEDQYDSYAEFIEWSSQRGIVPGSCVFAKQQGRYIGYNVLSILEAEGDPHLVEQGYIRVRKLSRSQGIATALGASVITLAKQGRYRAVQSHVSDKNAPMLAVARKLGFKPAGGETWVRKDFP